MRKQFIMLLAAGIAACGGCSGTSTGSIAPALSDSSGVNPGAGSGGDECSVQGQKQFVLDAMNFWYLWNDNLPGQVNLDDFATPAELLAYLSSFSPDDGTGAPIDRFSFLTTVAADEAFFGEGEYEGFGFGSRFEGIDIVRLTRVFADSPAARAGFERGQQIVALDGRSIAEIEAAEGVDAVLESPSVEFTIRNLDDSEFTVSVAQGVVTIDPVPQYRVIDNNGSLTGYVELETFISTADAKLEAAFDDFIAAGVQDVIIDLRYNGGGLVSTAELLGDLLGGSIAQGLVFSETRFNADRVDNNTTELFELKTNSLSLARLVIIASENTASASELLTNSMEPTSADVVIVGDRTFGKPVGQVGLEFCGQLIRPTAFQTLNGEGFGDYFDGLPADFTVDDDLDTLVGADDDPNIVAALTYLETGAWPPQASGGVQKASRRFVRPETWRGDSSARVYAGAR